MSTLTGNFSDGLQLRSQPVTVDFSHGDLVVVEGAGLRREIPARELRVSDRLAGIPRFLYLPGGEVVETPDNDAVDAALSARGRGRVAGGIHFLERHRWVTAVATLLLVTLSVTTIYFGLPRLARRVAMAVPVSIEQQAGRAALLAIRQQSGPTQLDRPAQNRVRRQLIRLLPEKVAAERPTIEFVAMRNLPNAFALPGNTIVVTDEFARLARNDDEIAAVLAHEIGHLEARHGMQSVLRGSMALLVVTSLTGDLATLTSFASTLPLVLLRNGYSRDLEREADRFAYELMVQRDIPLRGFATILRRLEESRPKKGADLTYLSTHPATTERVAQFDPVLLGAEQPATAVETASSAEPSTPTGARPPAVEAAALPGLMGAGDSMPEIVHQVQPGYPFALRAAGVEGEVVVGFIVDSEGGIAEAHVVRATHPDFGPAAVAAVNQWRFRPGRKDGRAVNTRMQVPVVFSLNPPTPSHGP